MRERVAGSPVATAALATAGLLACAAAGVAVGLGAPSRVFPHVLPVAVLVAVAAGAYVLWHTDPIYPLSGAVACSLFSGNWEHVLASAPVPPDRALLALAAAMVVLRAPRAADREPFRMRPVHWLIAAAALYASLSAVVAGTLGESAARYALLDRFGLVPFAAFLLAPLIVRTERQRAVLLATFVLIGAYLSLIALVSFVGLDALVFPRYIADAATGIHFGRARGPFLEGTTNGFALFACGVAAAIAVATWRDPLARLSAAAVVGLCVLGVILALQRSVWIGAVAATLVALAAAPRLRRYLIPAVALGAVFAFAAFALVPELSSRAGARLHAERSVWDRENLADAALRMIEARPLLGFGWGAFRRESQDYFWLSDERPLTAGKNILHSVYQANAVELGLLGAALWLAALLVAIGGVALRRGPPELGAWRAGLIAILVLWLVLALFSPLVKLFPNLVLWLWAGVVATGAARASAPAGTATGTRA